MLYTEGIAKSKAKLQLIMTVLIALLSLQYTWECRGRGLRTIIDYFAVRKALRQTVADVKVIRGAEAGSDHYLVLMKVNLRWTRRKKEVRNEGTRLRLRNWGEQVRLQTELGKLFEKASDRVGEDVEEVWKEFKGAILEVTERVVGRQSFGKHRKATSWWSSDVKEAVKRKKGYTERPLMTRLINHEVLQGSEKECKAGGTGGKGEGFG